MISPLRNLEDNEGKLGDVESKAHFAAYKKVIAADLGVFCTETVRVITAYLLPMHSGHSDEAEVFYHELLAHQFKFMATYCEEDGGEDYTAKAKEHYTAAMGIARKTLSDNDTLWLKVVNNASVFYVDVLQQPNKGYALAEKAYRTALLSFPPVPISKKEKYQQL